MGDFIRLLGIGSEFEAKFNFTYQKQAGGITKSLYLNRNIVKEDNIAIILGDNIFADNFESEISDFENSNDYGFYFFLKQVDNPTI